MLCSMLMSPQLPFFAIFNRLLVCELNQSVVVSSLQNYCFCNGHYRHYGLKLTLLHKASFYGKGRRYVQTSVSLDTSDGVIPVNKILGPSLFSEAAGLVEFLSKMDQQIFMYLLLYHFC